jgi:amino acid transporter
METIVFAFVIITLLCINRSIHYYTSSYQRNLRRDKDLPPRYTDMTILVALFGSISMVSIRMTGGSVSMVLMLFFSVGFLTYIHERRLERQRLSHRESLLSLEKITLSTRDQALFQDIVDHFDS